MEGGFCEYGTRPNLRPFRCRMSMPATAPIVRRGFTLLELIVVVAILIMVVMVFATFLGPGSVGPSVERAARGIRAMVTNARQNSSVRKVHSEVVIDYRRDQVITLARRRLATFSFDGDSPTVGSGNIVATTAGETRFEGGRGKMLRDGVALELPTPDSRFTIPWMQTFEVGGDYQGVAASFDYFPLAAGNQICTMPGVFSVAIGDTRRNAIQLRLTSGAAGVTAETWCALYRWVTIEVAVSSYGVSLYVDGRLSEARLPEGFQVGSAAGREVQLGGAPCRIDNFELNALVSSQNFALDGAQFVHPGVDPMLEATMQAEEIYRDHNEERREGPITPSGDDAPPPEGLPRTPPPAIAHIYFNTAGKLDPAKHEGAAYLYLVSIDDGVLDRLVVTIHTLGSVTWEYVEYFPWEDRPEAGGPE